MLEVIGASEHNLKNVDCSIPSNKLTVITGVSGCGKSSLAFDTIYAEGQRRYLETFSAYFRNYLGNIQRPNVESIKGLSPVIAIQQKTTNRNPNSTVGTITEINDFLRLLFARASKAYSYVTGKEMQMMHDDSIVDYILEHKNNEMVAILAPVVKGRKGHYRELFQQIQKQGYTKVRIDGEMKDIENKMQVDRYRLHDIEVVIDRLSINTKNKSRLIDAVQKSLKMGKGFIKILTPDKECINLSRYLMCLDSGIAYDEPQPNTFSFNSPYGWCNSCRGSGYKQSIDQAHFILDKNLSIEEEEFVFYNKKNVDFVNTILDKIFAHLKIDKFIPIKDIDPNKLNLFFSLDYLSSSQTKLIHKEILGRNREIKSFFDLILFLDKDILLNDVQKFELEKFLTPIPCPECKGSRLKKEALWFKVKNQNIAELSEMSINQLYQWFDGVYDSLDKRQQEIAKDILKEIKDRLSFLVEIGLGYLTLNRRADSLSGGETQRIRLATQIGSKLMNVLYILDEPSIGLHQRDNLRLIESLKKLRDFNNTILVVEHDREMIQEADNVIDMGPKAGINGGEIVFAGDPKKLLNDAQSSTSKYLSRKQNIAIPTRRKQTPDKQLQLLGASGNNLKDVTLTLPLENLIAITGVSGSGKSSLITSTLYPILQKHFYKSLTSPLPYSSIKGLEHLDKVIDIDQSPIGRTPRSNPATYVNIFTEIRTLFANVPESKIRGYKIGVFSFNVKGGRCETCKGGGHQVLSMNFLPDIEVLCPDCQGKRYNRQTLEIRYKGKNIYEVLEMNIEEAHEFFSAIPPLKRKLKTLLDVGLGYIKLGQSSTTLSGGEAQRVKLSKELSKIGTGKTLYILDEPTTGLHFEDIDHLIAMLQKLVDKKNTVIVIEHNMDVIKVADYIIDMGPEGGDAGGQIVFSGTPEKMIKSSSSETAKHLKIETEETLSAK